MPVIILGGIFGGFVTATEGAALAVVAALVIAGVIYRDLNLKELYRACINSALQTAVVMLLVASSALVGVYLYREPAPAEPGAGDGGPHHQSLPRTTAAQYLTSDSRHVPALGGGDHPHRADRHADRCSRSASIRSISGWCSRSISRSGSRRRRSRRC